MFEEAYEVLENDFIDTDETVISAVFHLKKCYFLETNDACYFNLEDCLFRRDSRPQSKTCAFTGCALSESISRSREIRQVSGDPILRHILLFT